jgi:AcrR family transcriptional regulator
VRDVKHTQDMILKASVKVFSQKGYTEATTKEIAMASGLSEMTLFRRFESKHELFIQSLRYALDQSIDHQKKINYDLSIMAFIKQMLHQKLFNVSMHKDLFKMFLRERLSQNIPKEYDMTQVIIREMKEQFDQYNAYCHCSYDASSLSKWISACVLQYIVNDASIDYHELSLDKQQKYVNTCLYVSDIKEEK